jgi:hypothetical protein
MELCPDIVQSYYLIPPISPYGLEISIPLSPKSLL